MRFLDKLTGGGVDWEVQLDSNAGSFRPGDTVAGRVRYTPQGNMEVRSIRAELVATEHYVRVVRTTRSRSGSRGSSTSSKREWFSDTLFRQEVQPSGPTTLVAQQAGEIPFQFPIPANALPSFDSPVLRLRWQIHAWMDVGGKDPSTERDIFVIGGSDRHMVADPAALAPSVSDPKGQANIYIEPAPLVVGQPFRGYVETADRLDPGSVRVELKQVVTTEGGRGGILAGAAISFNQFSTGLGGGSGVTDNRVLWAGQLAPMDAGPTGQRYQFSGQLPLAPVGSVDLPHGSSTTVIDIVISRRLQPDRHLSRPVVIVTG